MQRQNVILQSPVGPLAWELRLGDSRVQHGTYEGLNVFSSNLPEIRCTASLPVPSDSDACRFARNRWFQAVRSGRILP